MITHCCCLLTVRQSLQAAHAFVSQSEIAHKYKILDENELIDNSTPKAAIKAFCINT